MIGDTGLRRTHLIRAHCNAPKEIRHRTDETGQIFRVELDRHRRKIVFQCPNRAIIGRRRHSSPRRHLDDLILMHHVARQGLAPDLDKVPGPQAEPLVGLLGPPAKAMRHHLMPEADPQQRFLGRSYLAQQITKRHHPCPLIINPGLGPGQNEAIERRHLGQGRTIHHVDGHQLGLGQRRPQPRDDHVSYPALPTQIRLRQIGHVDNRNARHVSSFASPPKKRGRAVSGHGPMGENR